MNAHDRNNRETHHDSFCDIREQLFAYRNTFGDQVRKDRITYRLKSSIPGLVEILIEIFGGDRHHHVGCDQEIRNAPFPVAPGPSDQKAGNRYYRSLIKGEMTSDRPMI